jgi:hypothetical protein
MKNKRSLVSIRPTFLMAAIILAAMSLFQACKHEALTPTLPAFVTFSGDIQPLFAQHCSLPDCHSGAYPSAKLNLSPDVAYDQLFAKHEIDTLQPTKSLLYIQMNSYGTPMPPTGRLGDYEVGIVLKWIQLGARKD